MGGGLAVLAGAVLLSQPVLPPSAPLGAHRLSDHMSPLFGVFVSLSYAEELHFGKLLQPLAIDHAEMLK